MINSGLKNVSCKFYNNGRHDILHEYQLGIAMQVFEDIKDWLEGIKQ